MSDRVPAKNGSHDDCADVVNAKTGTTVSSKTEEEEAYGKSKERLVKALDSMIFMPHLKAKEHAALGLALSPSSDRKSTGNVGRPWDRGDLYSRLQTFRPSTWFAKPESIGAQECARRGWENTGEDELTCETCHAIIKFPVPMDDLEPFMVEKVVGDFEKKMSEKHASTCPWRSSVCSVSLLQFPSLPDSTIIADYRERTGLMRQLLCLPPIASSAVETMFGSSKSYKVELVIRKGDYYSNRNKVLGQKLPERKEELTKKLMGSLTGAPASSVEWDCFVPRINLLGLCGWTLSIFKGRPGDEIGEGSSIAPENATLNCTLCGARIGLWTFFEGCQPRAYTSEGVSGKAIPNTYQKNKGAFSLNHQVATNITTTIAGGMFQMHAEIENEGPFGKPQTLALFSSETRQDSGDAPRVSGKKRSADLMEDSQGGAYEKRQKNTRTSKSMITAIVAQYRTTCSEPLDPISTHRPFCPWIHSYKHKGETSESPCGWLAYADGLVFDSIETLKLSAKGLDDDDGKGWAGKDLFRRVLSSVPVRK